MPETYSIDFAAWVTETAQFLREKNWEKIDVDHLLEEVESLGKSERRGINSQLIRLLLHLLKWQYQPQRRSDSWLDSITDARMQIQLAIEDSPSLRRHPSEQLDSCYQKAHRQASEQTGLALSSFPERCPYDIKMILTNPWLPT